MMKHGDKWRSVPLKRVAEICYGLGQPPPLSDDGIPIIRATNISRGEINSSNLIFSRLRDLPLGRAPLLRAGEVLVVRSGAYTGDSARISGRWVGSAPGYDLRLTPRRVDSRFLAYALLGKEYADQVQLASSRAAQPHLNSEELGDFRIHVAPPAVQHAVADFLDAETAHIDALMARKNRLVELAKERFQSQLDCEVRRGLELFSRVRLGHVVHEVDDRIGDQELPTLLSVSIHDGVLPRSEITDKVPRADELAIYKVCRRDDIVLNRMRAFQGAIGVAPRPGIVSPDYAVLRACHGADPRYLHHIFRSPWFVGQMSARLRGIGGLEQGNVRTPRVNVSDLRLIEVPMPALDHQGRIADELNLARDRARRLSARMVTQIELLKEHRQALITAAVTGELEIPGVGE